MWSRNFLWMSIREKLALLYFARLYATDNADFLLISADLLQ